MPSEEWQEKLDYVEDVIERMFDGGIGNGAKGDGWDDSVWVDTVVDTVKYVAGKEDGPDFDAFEIRDAVDELAFQERIRKLKNDMWRDDKVVLDD